jgi:regulator of protease activity HflC (stomatin/prohibitin superfamily)
MTVASITPRPAQYSTGVASTPRVNVVALAILLASLVAGGVAMILVRNPIPLIVAALIGAVLMQSPRIAQQWERALVLRLGRFIGIEGQGLFWIVPFMYTRSL